LGYLAGAHSRARSRIAKPPFKRTLVRFLSHRLGVCCMIHSNNVSAALIGDRRAVTALEYGIIAGVLGLVLILIFQNFGTTLSTLMSTIGKSI